MRQTGKKLALALCITPFIAIEFVVISTRFGRQPNFMQWFLQVDHNLAAVGKHQGHHATHALVVNVSCTVVVDTVATGLHRFEQVFSKVQEFRVGHNFTMLAYPRILVRTLVLAVCAATLGGCGQSGPLYLPTGPAAAQRATLPQILIKPAAPAASSPAP